MRFAPTEDQLEFATAVRDLLADTCTPNDVRSAWGGAVGAHTELGSGDGRVRPAWEALAEMGVLGLTVPETAGGLGMADDDLVGIIIECGRAGLPDPVSDTAGVVPAVLRGVDGDSASQWLERIAGGATVVVGFGADPLVAAATTADAFLLFENDPASSGAGNADDSCGGVHLVPADEVELTGLDSVDGSRALARVHWTPSEATAVAVGADATSLTLTAFDRAAVLDAALLLGLSRAMLDMTIEYVGERKQFGVAIGTFQAVKHQLADAGLAMEFAEPLVRDAAHQLALGAESTVAASMAKARASQAALGMAEATLQCHGAIGYTVEHDLHLFMKRAWALARRHGDADWHRARVRAALLGG